MKLCIYNSHRADPHYLFQTQPYKSTLFLAGDLIAIASQNGSIYLFRVSRDGFSYKKSNKIRGSQPLIQMDWSSDSNFLQTVTADFDLCFCKFLPH